MNIVNSWNIVARPRTLGRLPPGYDNFDAAVARPALDQLLQHESGWDPTATNPNSGAFGLFQFLGHENDQYGAMGGYSADPGSQINAGLRYIYDRYGSPSAAWSYWQQHNSYQRGGWVRGTGTGDRVPALLEPGEYVMSRDAVKAFSGAPQQFPGAPGAPGDFIGPGGEGTPMAPVAPGAPFIGPAIQGPKPRAATPWMGRSPGQGLNIPHGGGIGPGGGGLIGLAEQAIPAAAASAAGAFPGGAAAGALASAAAQIAIDEINRAIQFSGQAVGIGVQGIMETLLPNESALADPFGGWLGRIASAAAGVGVAAPNIAGMFGKALEDQQAAAGEQPHGPDQVPGPPSAAELDVSKGKGSGPPPGPVTTNINVTNQRATEDGTARDIAYHQGQANGQPMFQGGR